MICFITKRYDPGCQGVTSTKPPRVIHMGLRACFGSEFFESGGLDPGKYDLMVGDLSSKIKLTTFPSFLIF